MLIRPIMNDTELTILVVSVISISATMPWASVLIRYRALYTPTTGVQDGDFTLAGRPRRYKFISLMWRIYQIEGISGVILKGLVLRSCEWSLSFTVAAIYFHLTKPKRASWDFTKPGLLLYLMAPVFSVQDIIFLVSFTILLRLPFYVLVVRATTTRYILSYRKPVVALRILLSPMERRAPWLLFAIPGLFLGFLLQTVIPLGLTILSGRLLYPHLDIWNHFIDIYLAQILISLGSTALCVPLYVANTRLAMSAQCPTRQSQRQDQEVGSTQLSERRLWDAQEANLVGLAAYCREEEDPIVFRGHLHNPYTGLVDCLATIVKEEGLGTLFCGWGLSVLGQFACI
ncbi:hypothetical protein Moror_14866 [Moniliophthora roreri MCA 2997]|uniref:Mitochondrial carrier n=1 Tax=Moniliophthora roreri (strain MCA 2997) TaxID=1381753 RepID=V2X3B2_MONRO|nr:hypothetical protein Moror_14866 [Moniliophthora roreri MCA 2997]